MLCVFIRSGALRVLGRAGTLVCGPVGPHIVDGARRGAGTCGKAHTLRGMAAFPPEAIAEPRALHRPHRVGLVYTALAGRRGSHPGTGGAAGTVA